MNLRYLHTFVSIVDSGSIARASARLNVSQPAASRQVLALEAELGVPLFDRIGRRLRLTSQGEDLLQLSRRLLMDADVLSARARALKGGHTGILRIGATPMVIEHMPPTVIAAMAARSAPIAAPSVGVKSDRPKKKSPFIPTNTMRKIAMTGQVSPRRLVRSPKGSFLVAGPAPGWK